MPRIFAVAALAFALATPLSNAKTLRWSSQGDYLTADPMAQNELLTNSINGHVYESLVERGKKLEIVPALAVSWKQTGPTVWVFNLRKGVKFHDGSPLTPTLAEPPPKLGEMANDPSNPFGPIFRAATVTPFTPLANVTGQPAMSVPLWWNEAGLPIGVQFYAPYGREDALLRLAAQLEEARPWRDRHPPVHA